MPPGDVIQPSPAAVEAAARAEASPPVGAAIPVSERRTAIDAAAPVLRVLVPVGVVASLILRLVHRGPYVAGLDVIGAAGGLHHIATMTPLEILRYYRDHHYRGVWNVDGVLSSLVPGWVTSHWPSEHWPPVFTFVTVVGALGLTGRAFELRWRDAWVPLLAWSASSALLSFSIAGFAYVSSIVPYALGLWIVFRWQRHWIATAALCVVAVESSWQVQEIGQTVFVLFLAAAVLLPGVPWKTRTVWLAAGGWQWWLAVHHLNFNTTRFHAMTVPALPDLWSRLGVLWGRILRLEVDLPVLLVAAVASVVVARRHRGFWTVMLVVHATLILLVAVNEGVLLGPLAVWSRRTLLLSYLCVAAIIAVYRDRPPAMSAIIGLLLCGSLWQVVDTARWARRPLNPIDDRDFTLPFVTSAIDYDVPFLPVRWFQEMRDQIDGGKQVLLVYNLSASDESPTNPAGILERLYLHFGHQRFVDSVLVFGSQVERNIVLPIRPMSTLGAVLDALDPTEVVGYRMEHPADAGTLESAGRFRVESATILAEVMARFRFDIDGPVRRDGGGRQLTRFVLHRR
jgi:hypothetical protein